MQKEEGLIRELLGYNAGQSREFAKLASQRKRWTDICSTKIIVFECMDGRVNFSLAAGLPFGIVSAFRSMGGIFDLNHPRFFTALRSVVKGALQESRDCLLTVTYHFSKSDTHCGCKGHGYDTELAKLSAERFCSELKEVFAKNKVHSIVLGIETDEDRFVVESSVLEELPCRIRKDLDLILSENAKHANEMNRTEKEKRHGENIIAVGIGFDWIHSYNRAFIIGPWHNDIDLSVATAAEIVLSNLKEGRVAADDGALLLCSTVPNSAGIAFAEKEAKALLEHCSGTIALRVPEILPHLRFLAGTTDPKTRKFRPISQ